MIENVLSFIVKGWLLTSFITDDSRFKVIIHSNKKSGFLEGEFRFPRNTKQCEKDIREAFHILRTKMFDGRDLVKEEIMTLFESEKI